jgi:hypothetical protein
LNGSISFIPAQGRDGPGATCSLLKGSYQFDKSNGPVAGPHEVIIRRSVGKSLPGGPAANTKGEWKLTADVPALGPYKIDFTLD